MNFRLKCEKPGEIEFTLTATMTADQWESVRDSLAKVVKGAAACELSRSIDSLLAQARRIYWPSDDSNGGNNSETT